MRKISQQTGLSNYAAGIFPAGFVAAAARPGPYLKTWRSGVDGNWQDAGDWKHKGAPNSLEQVMIAAAGSYTITVDTMAYARNVVFDAGGATLLIAAGGTLDLERKFNLLAGTLALGDGGSLNGGTELENGPGGSLLDAGAGAVASEVVSSGSIDVVSGVLAFGDGGTIGGIVSGSGTIDFAGGSFASSISVLAQLGGLEIGNGATLTLAGAPGVAKEDAIAVEYGTLAIGGTSALTVGGNLSFGSAAGTLAEACAFAGTLITTGQTTINGTVAGEGVVFGAGADWMNSGTVEDNGSISFSYSSSLTTNITNSVGAYFILTGAASGRGDNSPTPYAMLTNLGVLADAYSFGTVFFGVPIDNTGVIQLEGGTLILAGGGSILGTVAGHGTLGLGGTYTSTLLAIGDNAALTVSVDGYQGLELSGPSGTFAGTVNTDGGGLLSFAAGMDVTMAGISIGAVVSFGGAGTLTTVGNVTLSQAAFGDDGQGITWINTGSATESQHSIYFNSGALINETGASLNFSGPQGGITFYDYPTSFVNEAAARVNLIGSTINLDANGDQSVTLTNLGTITSMGNSSIVGEITNSALVDLTNGMLTLASVYGTVSTLSNSGTIEVNSGSMFVSQAVTGAGSFVIGAGGVLGIDQGAGATQMVDFAASAGTLQVENPLSFLGDISGFAGSDVIDLLYTAATGLSYADDTLTVVDNGATVASLYLSGSYNAGDFALSPDNDYGTDVKFV